MADTFTELERLVEECSAELSQYIVTARRIKGNVDALATSLGNMGTKWSDLQTNVDALVVAEPDNTAAVTMKSKLDRLLLNASEWSTIASDTKTAVDPIIPDRETVIG